VTVYDADQRVLIDNGKGIADKSAKPSHPIQSFRLSERFPVPLKAFLAQKGLRYATSNAPAMAARSAARTRHFSAAAGGYGGDGSDR